MTSSVDKKNSRYVQGGLTDAYPTRLGWWERYPLELHEDDTIYNIPPEHSRRPDKVAFAFYGRASYAWIILQYNNIVDINLEFISGKEIRVPTIERVTFDIMNKTTGGNPVT